MHAKTPILTLAATLLGLAPLLPARAANSVSNTATHATFATLADAVAALSEDGQTLLLAPGTYAEPELTLSYAVTIRGQAAADTFLQPAAATRIATVNIPAEFEVTLPVVFENLTLRNGNASGNGGALLVQEGSLLLRHCTLSNNTASASGGALFCMSGADAALAAEDTLLTANTAGTTGGGATRGAFLRCTFTANTADDGGAAAFAALDTCTLSANTATGHGGALYACAATRCVLRDNTALFGGAAFSSALANALLTRNTAAQSGGGLYNGTATNCTLVANTAADAGGGLWGGTAVNTLFYANHASAGADHTDASALLYSRSAPLAAGTGNTAALPRFRNADSGDYSLLSHSPCANAGLSAAAPPGTDLNGNPRVQGAAVEIGAYELDPSVIDYYGFEQWLHRNGLPIEPQTQFSLDHDSDGIPNGFAYAFGPNRIDGALLSLRHTAQGVVAETAPRDPESVGFVDVWVETAGALTNGTPWAEALPVSGAPADAARYRRDAPDAATRGFFRLKAALPPPD